jgi:hypothetical protein
MGCHGVSLPQEMIAEFCKRHHIRKLALFGSVLREDFRPDSDVDVLVGFEPGHTVGLLRMAGLGDRAFRGVGAESGPADAGGAEPLFPGRSGAHQ